MMLRVDYTLMAKALHKVSSSAHTPQHSVFYTHTHTHTHRDISNYLMAPPHAVLLCKWAVVAAAALALASAVASPLAKYLRLRGAVPVMAVSAACTKFLNATAKRNFPIIIACTNTHTYLTHTHTLR